MPRSVWALLGKEAAEPQTNGESILIASKSYVFVKLSRSFKKYLYKCLINVFVSFMQQLQSIRSTAEQWKHVQSSLTEMCLGNRQTRTNNELKMLQTYD